MTPDAKRRNRPDELLLWLRGRYPNDTDEELTKRFREHARDDLAIVDRLSDFFLGLNFNRLLRPARAPRPESPKEKAELQNRVNSLVDKWAVQHAERIKAAKRRRRASEPTSVQQATKFELRLMRGIIRRRSSFPHG